MRTLIRLVLALLLVVGIGALVVGYWAGTSFRRPAPAAETRRPIGSPAGTSGAVDADRARELGAQASVRVGEAGARAAEEMREAAITARIKAKMALDEAVKARDVDITTTGTTVTLRGTVETRAERERAERLAAETEGVDRVVNNLTVRP